MLTTATDAKWMQLSRVASCGCWCLTRPLSSVTHTHTHTHARGRASYCNSHSHNTTRKSKKQITNDKKQESQQIRQQTVE